MSAVSQSDESFIWVGHRGLSSKAPENTLAAVEAALACGLTWIEIDIQLVEGEPVVFHDPFLERTTDGVGLISTLAFERLRSLDAGGGQKIPLLRELLELVCGRASVNVELKVPATKELGRVLTEFAQYPEWNSNQFLVSSFDFQELKRFRDEYPHFPIAALYYGVPLSLAESASAIGASNMHVDIEFATKSLVADGKKRGLRVLAYTVNREEELEKALQLGVDGVISDRADDMRIVFANFKKRGLKPGGN